MPTYEYVCNSCSHNFEVFLKMTDKPISNCPKCGKSVRQILSGGLDINFRGAGFYVNDKKIKNKSSALESGNNKCASCSASSCNGCS